MSQHNNPMQLGLILDGFTRDEMLFDVAQSGSLNTETALGLRVLEGSRPRIVQIHDKQESEDFSQRFLVALDRKSTRLNSSHQIISYAVFCLKKKKQPHSLQPPTSYSHTNPRYD